MKVYPYLMILILMHLIVVPISLLLAFLAMVIFLPFGMLWDSLQYLNIKGHRYKDLDAEIGRRGIYCMLKYKLFEIILHAFTGF